MQSKSSQFQIERETDRQRDRETDRDRERQRERLAEHSIQVETASNEYQTPVLLADVLATLCQSDRWCGSVNVYIYNINLLFCLVS